MGTVLGLNPITWSRAEWQEEDCVWKIISAEVDPQCHRGQQPHFTFKSLLAERSHFIYVGLALILSGSVYQSGPSGGGVSVYLWEPPGTAGQSGWRHPWEWFSHQGGTVEALQPLPGPRHAYPLLSYTSTSYLHLHTKMTRKTVMTHGNLRTFLGIVKDILTLLIFCNSTKEWK